MEMQVEHTSRRGRRISWSRQSFASSLPVRHPKDSANRIIGATALVEGIPLLTADREIRNSPVLPTIW
jgi:PIN domain nuclease of toxin-antitoxin system